MIPSDLSAGARPDRVSLLARRQDLTSLMFVQVAYLPRVVDKPSLGDSRRERAGYGSTKRPRQRPSRLR